MSPPARACISRLTRSPAAAMGSAQMDNDLQFDRAEFAAPRSTVCSACQTVLATEYYAINGQVFCAKCTEQVRRHFDDGAQSRLLGRAALLGLGAAVAGSAVYAVLIMQQFAFRVLISVGIGWLVGKAVRRGSGNLGGSNYQLLAAVLTYLSICGAYGAVLVRASGWPGDAGDVLNLVLAALTKPISGGLNGIAGIYGLAAIAFGVWEAWRMNHPVRLEIIGPHGIGGPETGG